jgi:hypothetical protein
VTSSLKFASKSAAMLLCMPALLMASGQQGPPERDASSMATVQTAIAAMGGSGWASVTDSVTTGKITPTQGSPVQPASFVFKTLGGEVRYDNTGDSWVHVFASGHGKPAASQSGTVKALPYHVILGQAPLFLPALVLAMRLADSNYSLIDKGTTQVQGKTAFVVQSSYSMNQPVSTITFQTWYFDSSTGLPLRVESRLPDTTNMSSWMDAATDFSNFSQVGNLVVPLTMNNSEGGSAVAVVLVNTVQFNVGS